MRKKDRTLKDSIFHADGTVSIPAPNGKFIIVDNEDFDKLKNYTWYVSYATGYPAVLASARTTEYKNVKVAITKIIMNFPEYDIKHINGDYLDNRKTNLELTKRNCRKSSFTQLLDPLSPSKNDTKYKKQNRTLEKSIHHANGITSIPLTKGLYATIDSIDFNLVKEYTWSASRCLLRPEKYYAKTIIYKKGYTPEYKSLHSMLTGNIAEGYEVDHKDLNGLNNCRDNLRVVTHQQNSRNISPKKNCKSGIPGVFFNKATSRWVAEIGVNYKNIALGSFRSKEEAANARWKAEKEIDSDSFRGHKNG